MKTNLSTLSLSAMMLAGASSSALAIDFNDKFYGKGEVNIGYSARFYSGDVKDAIDGVKSEGESHNSAAHSLAVGTGFNVFYKATDKIHPFVGLGVEGKYAFKNEFVKDNKFQNFLNVNAKLGSAFKVNKDLTVRPYALVGMSVNQYKTKEVEVSGAEEDGYNPVVNVSGRFFGETNLSDEDWELVFAARLHIFGAMNGDINGISSWQDTTSYFFRQKVDSVYLSNAIDSFGLNSSVRIDPRSVLSYSDNKTVMGTNQIATYNLKGTEEEKFTSYMQQLLGDNFSPLYLMCSDGHCVYADYSNLVLANEGRQHIQNNAAILKPLKESIVSNLKVTLNNYKDTSRLSMPNSGKADNVVTGPSTPSAGGENTDANTPSSGTEQNSETPSSGSDPVPSTPSAGGENTDANTPSSGTEQNPETPSSGDADIESSKPVARMKSKNTNNIGINVGTGIELVIRDRYTVGAEYRYTDVKVNGTNFKTHDISVRFGVQFW